MSKTKIEWTDYSWNPILADNKEKKAAGVKRNRGYGSGTGHYCEKVSAGCKNCYAESQQPRFGNSIKFSSAYKDKVEIYLDEKTLTQPLQWKEPKKIFVCDMSDLFGSWVKEEWLDKIFAVMALTPHHTYQVLTKRPELMMKYFTYANDFDLYDRWNDAAIDILNEFNYDWHGDFNTAVLPNVWVGTSVEDQQQAEERIPFLLKTPVAVRFLSCEPLLGEINIEPFVGRIIAGYRIFDRNMEIEHAHPKMTDVIERIHWVIAGGESGHNARPMHPDWARGLRDQCNEAGVPFFFKQWGEYMPVYYANKKTNHPLLNITTSKKEVLLYGGSESKKLTRMVNMRKVGKKAAGRLLDGKEYNDWPVANQVEELV